VNSRPLEAACFGASFTPDRRVVPDAGKQKGIAARATLAAAFAVPILSRVHTRQRRDERHTQPDTKPDHVVFTQVRDGAAVWMG
jgi:hypothetical protein